MFSCSHPFDQLKNTFLELNYEDISHREAFKYWRNGILVDNLGMKNFIKILSKEARKGILKKKIFYKLVSNSKGLMINVLKASLNFPIIKIQILISYKTLLQHCHLHCCILLASGISRIQGKHLSRPGQPSVRKVMLEPTKIVPLHSLELYCQGNLSVRPKVFQTNNEIVTVEIQFLVSSVALQKMCCLFIYIAFIQYIQF